MSTFNITFLTIYASLFISSSRAQQHDSEFVQPRYFSVSAGYNGSAHNFIDVGSRYHVQRDQRHGTLEISGPSAGMEIGIGDSFRTFIPYLGWQGYYWGLAYGIRAEYIINPNYQGFSITPEFGFSAAEWLRFTVGWRFPFYDDSELRFNRFRFGFAIAVPFTKGAYY